MQICQVCSGEAVVISSLKTEDIITAWEEQGVHVSRSEFDNISLTRCKQCNFEAWQPSWVGDGELYAQLSRFPWYYERNKWEHIFVLGHLRKDSKILEVGCGKGEFLKLLVSNGIHAVGLDTNLKAVETAHLEGLNVIGKDIYDYSSFTDEKFDIICHFQVLEHIPEPLHFLETCVKLLKPDGVLFVATPNQDSFIKYAPFPLLNMPPHHQGRWSVSTFQKVSQLLNFELTGVEFEPLHKLHTGWALQCFVNRYLQVGIDRPHSLSLRPLWKWVILKLAERLGKIIFFPESIRNHICGHSILISMKSRNLISRQQ